MPTIQSLVASARQALTAAGVRAEEAALDARLLAEHVLGWEAARFLTDSDQLAPADFSRRYDALIARRVGREPMAYIIGVQEFWGLAFEVTPDVLIPRPETELVLETALSLATAGSFRAADICTGSGCLAVALATERADAAVIATDISAKALSVARRNAARHDVASRVQFIEADLFPPEAGVFDLVMCNPPYVREGDRRALQPEVRDHEPASALFGGPDGLGLIRRLIDEAPRALAPGGTLIFEFGYGQSEAVEELMASSRALSAIDVYEDLQGIPRVAAARLKQ